MEAKFNSLFDNDVSQKNTDYYKVDTIDTTLLLNKLILGEDVGKSRAVEILGSRNFGNFPNYLLSGRPCATRGCPPEKFCDSSGWPESPTFVPEKTCDIAFAPNSQRGDPNMWARKIDLEAKLFNMDYKDSKCHLKEHKENPCERNPESCELGCHRDAIAGDYMLPRGDRTWDTDPQPPRTLSSAIERANKNKEKHCKDAVSNFEKAASMRHFQPTKRRDVLDW